MANFRTHPSLLSSYFTPTAAAPSARHASSPGIQGVWVEEKSILAHPMPNDNRIRRDAPTIFRRDGVGELPINRSTSTASQPI